MNINAVEQLNRVLDEIEAKIKLLESSPNCAIVLAEYNTLNLFHWFNECFKIFWKEFDHHSVSQLLYFLKIKNEHAKLCNSYFKLLREQISYLDDVIDFDNNCVKDLPPVIFSEDNSTAVIGYYLEQLKDNKDDKGKLLYNIFVDRDYHYEVVDGKEVPIDFYTFRSDIINESHFKGLLGMWKRLTYIFELMCAVCSYPNELIYDFELDKEDIISSLENELRQYAKEMSRNVERDLRRTAQKMKTSRNTSLTTDIWGKVMDEEDELYDLIITDQLDEKEEKRLEYLSATKEQLVANFSLLQKIKSTCLDEELFDIRLAVDTHNLLTSLNADNLDLFYELVLRRNILQREIFPEKLRAKYEEWVNSSEEHQPDEGDEIDLSEARHSKLDQIIGILQKGKWKQPATSEMITHLLNVAFGYDLSLFDEDDKPMLKKMWALVEGGRGDRKIIVSANLAGFFSEENLLAGTSTEISNDLFGNNNYINNINDGKKNNRSIAFEEVIPFLTKYTNKIIRKA